MLIQKKPGQTHRFLCDNSWEVDRNWVISFKKLTKQAFYLIKAALKLGCYRADGGKVII